MPCRHVICPYLCTSEDPAAGRSGANASGRPGDHASHPGDMVIPRSVPARTRATKTRWAVVQFCCWKPGASPPRWSCLGSGARSPACPGLSIGLHANAFSCICTHNHVISGCSYALTHTYAEQYARASWYVFEYTYAKGILVRRLVGAVQLRDQEVYEDHQRGDDIAAHGRQQKRVLRGEAKQDLEKGGTHARSFVRDRIPSRAKSKECKYKGQVVCLRI